MCQAVILHNSGDGEPLCAIVLMENILNESKLPIKLHKRKSALSHKHTLVYP